MSSTLTRLPETVKPENGLDSNIVTSLYNAGRDVGTDRVSETVGQV